MTEARVPGGDHDGDAATRAHRRPGDHPASEQAPGRRTPDRAGRGRAGAEDDAATRRHPRRPAGSATPPTAPARPASPARAPWATPAPGAALTGRRGDDAGRRDEAVAPRAAPRTPRPPDPRRPSGPAPTPSSARPDPAAIARVEAATARASAAAPRRPSRPAPAPPAADTRRATVWIRDKREAADPVFVDASGRRRLLWRAVGVVVALVCLALVALVVLAAVSGTPTPLTSGAAPFPIAAPAGGAR